MNADSATPSPQASPPLWHVFGASEIGSAHIRLALPNQDSVAHRLAVSGAGFVGAVADGHGGTAYVRSDAGARFAVQAAIDCLSPDQPSLPEPTALCDSIVSRWHSLVDADLRERPLSARPGDGTGRTAYGSTLIAAAANARWLVALQIGDGDCFVAHQGQPVQRIGSEQDRYGGEGTLSLCLDEAQRYFSVHVIDLDWAEAPPEFVLLSTDGVGKSFPSIESHLRAVEQIRELFRSDPATASGVAVQLPQWLNQVSQRGSGDDATLLVAARMATAWVW